MHVSSVALGVCSHRAARLKNMPGYSVARALGQCIPKVRFAYCVTRKNTAWQNCSYGSKLQLDYNPTMKKCINIVYTVAWNKILCLFIHTERQMRQNWHGRNIKQADNFIKYNTKRLETHNMSYTRKLSGLYFDFIIQTKWKSKSTYTQFSCILVFWRISWYWSSDYCLYSIDTVFEQRFDFEIFQKAPDFLAYFNKNHAEWTFSLLNKTENFVHSWYRFRHFGLLWKCSSTVCTYVVWTLTSELRADIHIYQLLS